VAVDQDLAASGPFHQAYELQKRALAGAGMSGEKDHLPFIDRKADITQGLVATGVALKDVVEFDHGGQASAGNTASTKARAANGRRSSALSPTPTK